MVPSMAEVECKASRGCIVGRSLVNGGPTARYRRLGLHEAGADLVDVHIVTFRKVTLISIGIRASFDVGAIRCLANVHDSYC